MMNSKYLAAILMSAAVPNMSFAQHWQEEVTFFSGKDSNSVIIQYHNKITSTDILVESYTLETIIGKVTIFHERTWNTIPKISADTITITSVPEGYVAIPKSLTLEEDAKGQIIIMQWSGV